MFYLCCKDMEIIKYGVLKNQLFFDFSEKTLKWGCFLAVNNE